MAEKTQQIHQMRSEFVKTFVQNLILAIKYKMNIQTQKEEDKPKAAEVAKEVFKGRDEGIAGLLMVNQEKNTPDILTSPNLLKSEWNQASRDIGEQEKQFKSIYKTPLGGAPFLAPIPTSSKLKPAQNNPIIKNNLLNPQNRPMPLPQQLKKQPVPNTPISRPMPKQPPKGPQPPEYLVLKHLTLPPVKMLPNPLPINKNNFPRPSPRVMNNLAAPLAVPRPTVQLPPPKGLIAVQSFAKPNIIESQSQHTEQPMIASVKDEKTMLGVPKIDSILEDSAVQTIECPGPNKQVLVYKNGRIQPTSFSLTNDEITNIMKEVSDKTKIPLMSGVFKAALGNVVITAVMSEFVGTRFIIQKKVSEPDEDAPAPSK